MPSAGNRDARQLTALMIAPDRDLARRFEESAAAARGFQILADLKSYPSQQTLDIRLRQLRPEVVLLDLATDLEEAVGLVRSVTAANPDTRVIGLHVRNDPAAIVRSLRQGASEFLCAPFEAAIQEQALARIRRLIEPRIQSPQAAGTVAVFASAKPGSGASTLAAQTAFALRRAAAGRVLLADLDAMSGTVTFYLKAGRPAAGVIEVRHGIDVLPAGMTPGDSLDIASLRELIARARQEYSWVLLDLPAIFHRATLLALPEADLAFLVTTSELPSLAPGAQGDRPAGTARLRQRPRAGPGEPRSQGAAGSAPSDVQKILAAPVHYSFPNDYSSLDRALAEGEPLAADCDLGRAIERVCRGAGRSRRGRTPRIRRRKPRACRHGGPSMNVRPSKRRGTENARPTWDQRILQNAGRPRSSLKPEYQELKFTLHRKLVDKINLEALATIDNQRVRGEVRQALISAHRRRADAAQLARKAADHRRSARRSVRAGAARAAAGRPHHLRHPGEHAQQVYVERKGVLELTNVTLPRRPAPAADHRQDRLARWDAASTNRRPWWTPG